MLKPSTWFYRLWPAVAFHFTFVAATALWKSAANAALLARFDATALPYLYVVAAFFAALFTGIVASQRARLLPQWLAVVGAVIVLGLSGLLFFRLKWAPVFLYLFTETFATFLSIVFWGKLSEAFDARESRRAFTVVSGLGMLGGMVGGFVAREWAPTGGVVGLLTLGVGIQLLGAYAWTRQKTFAPVSILKAPPMPGELVQYVLKNGYPRLLGVLVTVMAVLTAFSDYLFRVRASSELSEEGLAALFGGFQMWMGVFCVAWQLLLAERLLKRLGVIRYMAMVPLLLLPWAVAALLIPSVWPAYGLKLLEMAASLSVLPVGMQLLYGPVPDVLRDKLRSAIDGLAKKGGLGLGGLLLIATGINAKGPWLAVAVLALCCFAAVTVWGLGPLYLRTLKERVSGASFDDALDDVVEKPLQRALASNSSGQVLQALAVLYQMDTPLGPWLPKLLVHPDTRIQEKALMLIQRGAGPECYELVEAILREGPLPLKRAAIWALAQLNAKRAEPTLAALFDAPEWEIRAAAVGAILAYGEKSDVWNRAQVVLQSRVEMQEVASVDKRRESAQLLGRAPDGRYAAFLERYLNDEDLSVRRAAIVSVGEGHYVSLAPLLLSRLSSKDERRMAREALSRLGDEVVGLLRQVMDDRASPAALRYELPRVLRQIGTQAAFEALLFSNVQDDAFLHYRIGVALSRLSEEKPNLSVDVKWVLEAVGRRRNTYRQWVVPFRDLRAALGDSAILTRALGDRLDQAFELSFWLLGVLHDARALRRVHAHLLGNDNRRRAWAREYLDNQLPLDEWLLISQQVEAHHRELPPGAEGRLLQVLESLCQSDDLVVRALARQVAKAKGLSLGSPGENDMSEAIVQHLLALEGVEIFAQCDVDDVAAVAALAREQMAKKGERIYSEGDPGDALYVIVEGQIDALRGGRHVLTLNAKQAFGDVSLLDGSPRPTEMIAAMDCRLLVIDRRDFLDLVSDRPELLKGIYRAVAQQLRQMLDLPGNKGALAS